MRALVFDEIPMFAYGTAQSVLLEDSIDARSESLRLYLDAILGGLVPARRSSSDNTRLRSVMTAQREIRTIRRALDRDIKDMA